MPELHAAGAPGRPGSVPLCVPTIRGNEWKYVQECLDTGWVSSAGSFVDRFENEMGERLGGRHAVATTSGTAALHAALLVAGVRPDDEVIVSDLTFIAPVNAIRYVGAWPVLADVEPEHWQMDVQNVVDFLEKQCTFVDGELRNLTTGRRIAAIIPVHILGHPVDFRPLAAAAAHFKIPVIEDATESLGASYRGEPVGALGEMACLSFNGNKLLTTGGGGMLVTRDKDAADRARYLTTQAKDDPVEYVHGSVGYNYRLPNILAALGVAQLESIEAFLAAKRDIARRYADAFADVPGLLPMREAAWARSAWWMYTVLIEPDTFPVDSRALMRALAANGIQARPLWQPMQSSPAHPGLSMIGGGNISRHVHARALSLPCSVDLTAVEQQRVIEVIRSISRGGERPG